MQSDNGTASPRANNRRPSKQTRPNQQQSQAQYPLSDSNLPNASTPRGKKGPRGKQNHSDERAASMTVPANKLDHAHQRNRPISTAGNPTVSVTPSKPAYAGSTFQASPAPASLPMPKFFSKSVPSANADGGLQSRMEKEARTSEGRDADTNTLKPANSGDRGNSPLDLFFRADREEKARKQSGSTLNLVSAPSRSDTPKQPKDLFMMEMEDPESPVAHKAQKVGSTPYGHGGTSQHDDDQRAAYTKSLKDLLKVGGDASPQRGTPPSQQSPVDHQASPQLHRQSPVTTPQNNHYQQYTNDFHYGNRNLSPLFQAARNDSPSRPSPLRQTSQPSPSSYSNGYNNFAPQYQQPQSGSPFQTRNLQPAQHQYQQPQHLNQSQQYAQPQFSPSHNPQHGYGNGQGQGQQPPYQQQHSQPSSDVKSMEDSLRKMLKLS
ncbi:hypothetical protein MBLNU457_1759t1 [Dothideomycetes sp. NU457]